MNKFQLITNEVKKVINGKDRAVVTTLLALLTGGNILIEDIPGVGKTTMAVAFSKALGLEYGRVQFTPDTLPSDITGFAVYNKDTGKFTFNKGAVFCNLFLADELNRTSSRTQAALLEAMEERQVTVEGNTFKLEKPFSVIATQNPTGASGTQLLPDSQIDRFTVRLSMGYPDSDAECKMLLNRSGKNPLDSVNCIVSKNEFLEMQSEVQNVFVSGFSTATIWQDILCHSFRQQESIRCFQEVQAREQRFHLPIWQRLSHLPRAEITLCREMCRIFLSAP